LIVAVNGESASDEKPAEDSGQPRIGLCVSGGGFRATFYAIGALRYLAEAGLLSAVTDISAVSGGSLAAAKLAAEWPPLGGDAAGWFVQSVERPMREAVANNNIRNRWLVKVATGRSLSRGGRGAVLGELFCEILELPSELHELPVGPRTIFTSTCLQTGRAFRFARAFTGSWDFGYAEPTPTGVRLGLALAASAAFPHTFTVVQMPTEPLGLPKETPSTITLVDGGVYDNLGLEWFQGRSSARPQGGADVDFVLAINASGALTPATRKVGAGRALMRDISVQYSQTLNVRVRWFVDRLLDAPGSGAYVGINRDPRRYTLADNVTPIPPEFYDGALRSSLASRLARVRTDLDCFTREETSLLSYHCYWSLHARLATFRPDLALARPGWREFADLSASEERRLAALLDDSARFRLRGRTSR
jgi:NTE family protein